MIRLAGRLIVNGASVTFEMDNETGVRDGHPLLLDMLESLAEAREGHLIGIPSGPYTRRNHLSSELSAYLLVRELLIPGTIDVEIGPAIPDVPLGAIP